MQFIKIWLLIMTFRYTPHNEFVFAMFAWFGMLGGFALSLYMAWDVYRS